MQEIKTACAHLLMSEKHTIKKVAGVIGKLVAAFSAVQYGPLYYRTLERDKTTSLRANCGHYGRIMQLSSVAKMELKWWLENVDNAYKCINRGKPDIELTSDASGLGWGATNGSTQIGGRWNHVEMANTLPRVTGSIFCFEIIL